MWRLTEEKAAHRFPFGRGHSCRIGQTSDTVVTFEGGDHSAGVRVRQEGLAPRRLFLRTLSMQQHHRIAKSLESGQRSPRRPL